jgi:predicted RNA binding protein YcfA (HicA-like mRNA interferase family)
VGRKEKLLQKILTSGGTSVQMSDFINAMKAAGFSEERQSGTSHKILSDSNGHMMNVQPMKDGKAKPYQVKQFQKLISNRKT